MKTLFKLVVAILVLNAAVRGGLAMWKYYQFKDAAQQVVLFGQRADPEEIQANIVAKAQCAGQARRRQSEPRQPAHDRAGLLHSARGLLSKLSLAGEIHVRR